MKVDFAKLDRAFNPRCVVVVGDKKDAGYRWLKAQNSLKGKLYSVQVAPQEIEGITALGIQNYTSLLNIPEPIDLVIVSVPRAVAPRILDDCIRKNVAAAHFFTSGFAETDTEEGTRLERQMREMAEAVGFHLIGPNCMGVYSPGAGVRMTEEQYCGPAGPVGLISQSGTHAENFSREAHLHGVTVGKCISFGNGIVLDSADYLSYLGSDDSIKIIGMYLEGVHDGQRFLRVLKEVSSRKPVVVWKGGRTGAGGRAIASHTGSMAIPMAVWESAMRQCGAVTVASIGELIDTLQALLYLPPVLGDRVAVAGGSGGQSVAIADVFAEAGLKVPLLTQASYDKLAAFFSLVGAGCRNPIDPGSNRKEMRRILNILVEDPNIDNLALVMRGRSVWHDAERVEKEINSAIGVKQVTAKPVMAVLPYASPDEMREVLDIGERLRRASIPVLPGFERGARALRNALEYYRLKDGAAA